MIAKDPFRGLSQPQWRFAHEYVMGAHAGNGTACYKIAYGGPVRSDRGARASASRLLHKPKIQAAIEALRDDVREAERLTPETHSANMRKIRDLALTKGDLSAALRAEVKRGECAGLYVHKIEQQIDHVPSHQLAAELRDLLNQNPQLLDGMSPEVMKRLEYDRDPLADESIVIDALAVEVS